MHVSSTVQPGSILTLTPHDLAVDGGGIARHGELVVFLDRGLPGETLQATITETKKRYARGVVTETLVPSPDETPSHCPAGALCGGCAWTTLAYPAQLRWKERQVKETFRRLGKVLFDEPGQASAPGDTSARYNPIIASPRPLAYRNKVEFAFGFADREPALGLRQRGSRDIVPVADCPLAAAPVAGILEATRTWMREKTIIPHNGKEGLLRFLVVRCPEYRPAGERQCVVELITSPAGPEEAVAIRGLGERLMAAGAATGFAHSVRAASSAVAYGETVSLTLGETTVHESVGPVTLRAPLQAFMQVNTLAAGLLYERVRNLAAETGSRIIWDLYSGLGGIALSLAGPGRSIRGFEQVAEAVRWATTNAEEAAGSVSFIRCDAAALPAGIQPLPELVVLDPPRAGIAGRLRENLLKLKPRHIISVSCDPASQARDIALLSPAYRLVQAGAVDLFPQTPHVESYALLTLRG